MWTAQNFMDLVSESSTEVDRVAAKIQPPPPPTMTPEEEQALYVALGALRDKLKSL